MSDGGCCHDTTGPVLDKCVFQLPNAYTIPNIEVEGRGALVNHPTNTAFRGFGAPQHCVMMELIVDQMALALGMPPHQVSRRGDRTRPKDPLGEEMAQMARLAKDNCDEMLVIQLKCFIMLFFLFCCRVPRTQLPPHGFSVLVVIAHVVPAPSEARTQHRGGIATALRGGMPVPAEARFWKVGKEGL